MPEQTDKITRSNLLIFLALLILGLAGNYYKFPLFPNIDLLSGSIFTFLALKLLGIRSGLILAIIISSMTYFLWHHPYAIVIMTMEVLVAHWLMQRYHINLILADACYWIFVGMPLVYVFYQLVMHVSPDSTSITMIKQAVNGITNVVIAKMVFHALSMRFNLSKFVFKEVIHNSLAFFVLIPSLFVLVIGANQDLTATDKQIQTSIQSDTNRIGFWVDTWMSNRKNTVDRLFMTGAGYQTDSPQAYFTATAAADMNVCQAELVDKLGHRQAYYASTVNEADKSCSTAGLTTIIHRQLGESQLTVEFNLTQLRNGMENQLQLTNNNYQLIDESAHTVLINDNPAGHQSFTDTAKGTMVAINSQISQWIPAASVGKPAFEIWKNSLYQVEYPIHHLVQWKLVMQKLVQPSQQDLFNRYAAKLRIIFFVLLFSLLCAEVLSRLISGSIKQLQNMTTNLPQQLQSGIHNTDWPVSKFLELTQLIDTFKLMADSLTSQFHQIQETNATLENRVQERTRALTESEHQLRLVLDTSPTAARITVRDMNQTAYYNAQYLAMTNNDSESIKNFDSSIYYDPEVLADITQTLEKGDDIIEKLVELHNDNDPTFGTKWMLASYFNMHYQGQPATIGWFHEITDRILLERMKGEFISTVSHELRTPLTSISGSLSLAMNGVFGAIPQQAHQMIEVAHRNCMRLTFLINDLLDMEKLLAGQMTFDMQECLVVALIKQSLEDNRNYQRERNVKLVFQEKHEHQPWKLLCDEQRFLQILSNLLSNAIKFSPDSAEVHVDLALSQQHPHEITISITDKGPGIPTEFKKRIFQKFSQADSSDTRKKGGTGLGLSITRELVEHMGGKIAYTSAVSQGSCFYVTFPLHS